MRSAGERAGRDVRLRVSFETEARPDHFIVLPGHSRLDSQRRAAIETLGGPPPDQPCSHGRCGGRRRCLRVVRWANCGISPRHPSSLRKREAVSPVTGEAGGSTRTPVSSPAAPRHDLFRQRSLLSQRNRPVPDACRVAHHARYRARGSSAGWCRTTLTSSGAREIGRRRSGGSVRTRASRRGRRSGSRRSHSAKGILLSPRSRR